MLLRSTRALIFNMKQELRRFPSLQAELAAAANEALERFREDSKKTVLRLVDMESSYLTVDFFRRLPQEMDNKGGNPANPANPAIDRYTEMHFRRIGSNVSSYVGMVSETLRNTIPKAVVHCQVKEAKHSLLNYFYTQIGKKEVLFLASPYFCMNRSIKFMHSWLLRLFCILANGNFITWPNHVIALSDSQ